MNLVPLKEMLMMVLETFHTTYERGLLGNIPQNKKKHVLNETKYFGHSTFENRLDV